MIASTGWEGLLDSVLTKARTAAPDAGAVMDTVLSMAGKIPVEQGLGALPRESRALVGLCAELPCVADLDLGEDHEDGVTVGIAPDGRVFLDDIPTQAAFVARIRATTKDAARTVAGAVARSRQERETGEAERAGLRDWLAGRDPAEIVRRLELIEQVLMHMAPVQIFVGGSRFTNLGRGNLPGRSTAVDAADSVLRRLRSEPVANWSADEGAFVVMCWILMASGPQSRLEEANGLCLDPEWLRSFLVARAATYALPGAPPTDPGDIDAMLEFSTRIARRRQEMLAEGRIFYREIHGVNLNKEEKLLPRVPSRDTLAGLDRAWTQWPELPETTAEMGLRLADRVRDAAVDERPRARAEALRAALVDAAEATRSDVAMARGPRDLYFVEDIESRDPLKLGTGDFYCCVVPSADFAARHRGQQPPLDKILGAYGARMRFNSWHYFPHVLGMTDGEREDWFFAPLMPDLTRHSEWHHTGHARFGVRYAIRIPLRVTLAGRDIPGLYDLRLMRATGEPYTVEDLSAAVALGQVIRTFHEQMYGLCRAAVTEFDNAWFRSNYADC